MILINNREKLTDPEMAQRIAGRVAQEGGRTFYVGGYVRDLLMKKENKDIDIEVHGISVKTLEEILDQVGKRTEMGASFGVFGLRGYDLDIAMPRKEEAIGRGHKDFKVDVDPYLGTYKAAIRRDFTINALMMDVLTGEIVDHFGGIEDLKNGLLRHVNDDTFVEDPLRVLRGAQFAARFHFKMAQQTKDISRGVDLGTLAKERIFGELQKALLKSDRPSIFFEELRSMDQLDVWFPELKALIGLPQNPQRHPEGDVWRHTMMTLDVCASLKTEADQPLPFMLTGLFHDLGKAVTTIVEADGRVRSAGHDRQLDLVEKALDRITKEISLKKYVKNMTGLHMKTNHLAKEKPDQEEANLLLDQALDPHDLVLFSSADHYGRGNPSPYREEEAYLKEKLESYQDLMARPQVMGADLVAAGLKPGAYFSDLLSFTHQLHLRGVPKEEALSRVLQQHNTQS